MEHLPRGDKQPYTTVLGLLQAMEKAGLVDHEKQGWFISTGPPIRDSRPPAIFLPIFWRSFSRDRPSS